VLGEPEPEVGPADRAVANVLLYAPKADRGLVRRFALEAHPASLLGCYLDPVAAGLMLIDASMAASLHRAFRISRGQWTRRAQDAGRALAVRIVPIPPPTSSQPMRLDGGSAGLLLTCGVFALSEPRPDDDQFPRLHPYASATAVLRIADEADEDQPLWNDRLQTGDVADRVCCVAVASASTPSTVIVRPVTAATPTAATSMLVFVYCRRVLRVVLNS
jgi:hypothetical protein